MGRAVKQAAEQFAVCLSTVLEYRYDTLFGEGWVVNKQSMVALMVADFDYFVGQREEV